PSALRPYSVLPCSLSMLPPPPRSTLFPYTTLFRSRRGARGVGLRPDRSLGGLLRHSRRAHLPARARRSRAGGHPRRRGAAGPARSEEHTSELQSRFDLVCRLLLEKKKTASTSRVVR